MANREKAGSAVIIVGVIAALFMHANTGDTGTDTEVCKRESGMSTSEIVQGTFNGHNAYNMCMNRREAARLEQGK